MSLGGIGNFLLIFVLAFAVACFCAGIIFAFAMSLDERDHHSSLREAAP